MRLHAAALSLADCWREPACRLRAGRAAARRAAGRTQYDRAGLFARRRRARWRRSRSTPTSAARQRAGSPAPRAGETDSRELPVYLTAAQAAAGPAADRLHERRVGHAGRLPRPPASTTSRSARSPSRRRKSGACASTCRPGSCSPATTPSASARGKASRRLLACRHHEDHRAARHHRPRLSWPRPRASRPSPTSPRSIRPRRRRAYPHPGGGDAQPGHGGALAARRWRTGLAANRACRRRRRPGAGGGAGPRNRRRGRRPRSPRSGF